MSESSSTLRLYNSDDVRRINQLQLMLAQSNGLSRRLSGLAELTKRLESLGKDPHREIRRMQDQRAELASQLRSAMKDDARYFSSVNRIKDRLTATVINIGDQLWPWSILELPTMAEGINQTPTASDTSGEIATAGSFQGTGAWGGMPENSGTEEQWWVHNWICTAVLPSAPHQGTVSYRFGANCEAIVYHTEGTSGLTSFITVGTTSNVSTPITNWQTVGWPFDVTLPQPSQALFGGGAPVVGDIKVNAGQAAAITVIIGVIVSIIDGYVMFLPDSTFGIGLLGQSGYTAWGKIQYRFNPLWVVEGANESIR
jgi:hypothetical protein